MTQDSTGTGPQFREVGNGCRTTDLSPSDMRGGRLQQPTDAAVAGLELELLQVPAALAQVRASHLQDKAFAAAVDPLAANRYISIGIRPVHCAALTITNCQFRFSLGAQGMTSGAAPTPPGTVFGMGVFAASDCAGLQLERNQFLCDRASRLDAAGAQHSLAGYRLTPTAVAPTADKNAFRQFNGSQVAALLHDLVIRDNTFDEISATAVVLAEFGTIRTWDNTIRRSYVGIWLVEGRAAALTDLGAPFAVPGELKDQAGAVHAAFATGLLDPVRLLLTVFARTFPLPDLATMEVTTPAVDAADTEKLQAAGEQARQEWMTRFVKDVAAGLTPIRPSRRRTAKATGRGRLHRRPQPTATKASARKQPCSMEVPFSSSFRSHRSPH